MADYGSVEYWEERYRREGDELFEWYQPFEGMRTALAPYLQPGQRVLVLGNGNSRLAADLAEDSSAVEVVAVDFSTTAVERMKQLHSHIPNLSYTVADVTSLPFQEGSFDLLVDKATMDSILCADQGEENLHRMLRSCARVMKRGGALVSVSHARPEHRAPYFQREEGSWTLLPHSSIAKPPLGVAVSTGTAPTEIHYVYAVRKH